MKMKMKQFIFDLIKTDLELRKKLSGIYGVSDNSIRLLGVRNSPKLTEYNYLNIIKQHTGLKDKDIFEKE